MSDTDLCPGCGGDCGISGCESYPADADTAPPLRRRVGRRALPARVRRGVEVTARILPTDAVETRQLAEELAAAKGDGDAG